MPLAPPVIKIVLLVSFIIKCLLSYVTIYKSHSTSTRRSIEPSYVGSGLHLDRLVFPWFNRLGFVACLFSGPRPSDCRRWPARKPFTKQFRLQLPRKRSGHEGVHDPVQPAWNDSGAVFAQTTEALRYALLDAHRFQRHGLRIEAKLFEHRCVRKPGCQYSDVDT